MLSSMNQLSRVSKSPSLTLNGTLSFSESYTTSCCPAVAKASKLLAASTLALGRLLHAGQNLFLATAIVSKGFYPKYHAYPATKFSDLASLRGKVHRYPETARATGGMRCDRLLPLAPQLWRSSSQGFPTPAPRNYSQESQKKDLMSWPSIVCLGCL